MEGWDPLLLHVACEDDDQTVQMCRLIFVFYSRTCDLMGLHGPGSFYYCLVCLRTATTVRRDLRMIIIAKAVRHDLRMIIIK